MATVSIVVSKVRGDATSRTITPVPEAKVIDSEVLDVTGVKPSGLTAKDGNFWVITVTGGDVWAHFYEDGEEGDHDAAPGKDWLIIDSTTREFHVVGNGKASFIPV